MLSGWRPDRALWIGLVALAACKPGADEPSYYAPTEVLNADCRVLPAFGGFALDAERPDELVSGDLFSEDRGATWHRVYDGQRLAEFGGNLYAVGDGMWLEASLDLTSRDGRLLTLPEGKVRTVELRPMFGGMEGLRGFPLDDGSYVGIDVRGRIWRSPDGTLGSWIPRVVDSRALGDRIWNVRSDGSLEASTDGGFTYMPRASPSFDDGEPLAADGVLLGPDGRVMVSAYTWVWTSDDDGATWMIGGGDPEWIARLGVGRINLMPNGDVYALAELNGDAAAPNPAGFYLLRTADWGASWAIVRVEDGGDGLPYPDGTVYGGDDGGLTFGAFRMSADYELCMAPATAPIVRRDAVVDPERTIAPVVLNLPLSNATYTHPVHVEGSAGPGDTVTVELSSSRRAYLDHAVVWQELTARTTGVAGTDGRFSLDADFTELPEFGSLVYLRVVADDGFIATEPITRDLPNPGTSVELAIESPDGNRPVLDPFPLVLTGTPGASLALYAGYFDSMDLLHHFDDEPLPGVDTMPPSGRLDAVLSLAPMHELMVLDLVATLPGSLASQRRYLTPGVVPDEVLVPEVSVVPTTITSPFTFEILTASYADFDWKLLDASDAVLAEATGVRGSSGTPSWQAVEVTYAPPASGASLRLRVNQTVFTTRSPDTEVVLVQQ